MLLVHTDNTNLCQEEGYIVYI